MAAGHANLGKTQDNDCCTVCCLKSDELWFVNTFCANETVVLSSVDLLYYVFRTVHRDIPRVLRTKKMHTFFINDLM